MSGSGDSAEAAGLADPVTRRKADPGAVTTLPRGVVTFLLTDIEGSSHLWESHAKEMAEVVQRHYDLLHEAVRAHRGALPVEQGEGDSVVAAFERGSDAVQAAVAAQRAILEETWPAGIDIGVRMALHSGEARLRDPENYVGEAIIRAARVRELGHGGQVLVSRACAEVVADAVPPGVSFRAMGPYRLKNLGRPEEIFQLCHPELPDVFGPLRGIDQVANNLPTQLTPFIGREADLAQIHALIEDSRLLTLTGSGGCGKTRLALQVAADLVEVHADGVWYVELAPLGHNSSVLASIADVLRVQASAEVDLLDSVVDRLRDRRALLVVDNCEHLLDDAAATIEALLRGSPSLRVLSTSRQPLNLPGEVTWRVPSLAVPGPAAMAVQTLEQFDAVRLFIDRAVRSRPNFVVTEENAPAIAAICAHVDGIPLAIELAAARVRSLSVERILDGLQDRFRLLTGGSRAGLPRHQTLRSSVEWSHQLLDDDERALLRRLSQFSGGFTLNAAEGIAGFDPLDDYGVLDHLSSLVERSLVILDDEGPIERYRLLETIKQFADEQLVASGEVTCVLERHLVHFAGFVAEVAPALQTGAQERARLALSAEHDNLRTALVHAESAASADRLSSLVFDLVQYWFQADHTELGIDWLDRAMARLGPDDHMWRGRLLWGRALLSLYYGDWEGGATAAQGAVDSATLSGDDLALGRAMDVIADFGQLADPLGQIPVLEEALRHATLADDSWSKCNITQKIGFSLLYADRFHEVPGRLDQALAVLDGDPNPFFLAWHHIGHGTASVMAGRRDAVAHARAAGDHADRSGEPFTRAWSTGVLVSALVERGDYDEAARAIDFARRELDVDG
ncbi:MAG: ATP-binding protein, partial [Microthrixaceae bacterium]